jgi:hypothetical protein
MMECLLAPFLLFGAVPPAGAPTIPSERQLAAESSATILAAPLDPATPNRFRVVRVLGGKSIKVGDSLNLEKDLPTSLVQTKAPPSQAREEPKLRQIEAALLFLQPKNPTGFQLVKGGLRFWTIDHHLLALGNNRLVVRDNVDWNNLVERVGQDAASMDRLHAALAKPNVRSRNQSLLRWLRSHHRQLGTRDGWGRWEIEVFDRILASRQLEDCWAAVQLYSDLHRGEVLPLKVPAFASPAGRRLLTDLACQTHSLTGDRVRALILLAQTMTLRPSKSLSGGSLPLKLAEQTEILNRLKALLSEKDVVLREGLAKTVVELSRSVDNARDKPVTTALEAIETAYKAEKPGPARDELARAVCFLGGPDHWKKLSANPPGLLAVLADFEREGDQIVFWLAMKPCGLKVYQQPTLVVERMALLGPSDTKKIPLPVANLERPWAEGWDGNSLLLVEYPVKGLGPGTWRVRVQGKAGKDGQPWTSEPRLFVVPAPTKKPGRPGRFRRGGFGKG